MSEVRRTLVHFRVGSEKFENFLFRPFGTLAQDFGETVDISRVETSGRLCVSMFNDSPGGALHPE